MSYKIFAIFIIIFTFIQISADTIDKKGTVAKRRSELVLAAREYLGDEYIWEGRGENKI